MFGLVLNLFAEALNKESFVTHAGSLTHQGLDFSMRSQLIWWKSGELLPGYEQGMIWGLWSICVTVASRGPHLQSNPCCARCCSGGQ